MNQSIAFVRSFAFILAISSASAVASGTSNSGDVEIRTAREVALFGVADLKATNDYLAEQGLEAIPNNGFATTALVTNDYIDNTLGAYREFYLAFVVKKIGEVTFDRPGYYFASHRLNDRVAGEYGRTIWMTPYSLSDISMSIADDNSLVESSASENGVLHASVKMGKSAQFALSTSSTPYYVYGYSPVTIKQVKYKIDVVGTAFSRPYDSSVDQYFIDPASETGLVMKAINFIPVQWSVMKQYSGTFSRPEQE